MSFYFALFLFFWLILLSSTVLAWRFGGKPERLGSSFMLVAAIGSAVFATYFGTQFSRIEYGLIFVDLLLFAAMVVLMIKTKRFWPIWANSFQLAAILTHLASTMASNSVANAYALLQGFWAYPMLIAMLLGTYGHHCVVQAAKHDTMT